jgi:hypothetical protein
VTFPTRGDHVVLRMRGHPRAVVLAVDDDVMTVQLVHGHDILRLPLDAALERDELRPQLQIPHPVEYAVD